MPIEKGYKMVKTVQCEICSNTETTLIQNTHISLGSAEIDLVRCNQCGLVYLNPQPTEDEIKQLYSDDYFIQWYSTEKKREFSKQFFRNLLIKNKLLLNAGCNILDIGCGMGFFLEVVKDLGYDVKGVDISPYAARYCRDKFNFDIHCGTLETANYQSNYFDIITGLDFLEHINGYSRFFIELKRVLKPDGMFIVIVPNYDSLVFQLDRIICKLKKSPLPNVPEHITYFTFSTLRNLFQINGFKVDKVISTKANDEGEYLHMKGSPTAVLRSLLNKFCYLLGNVSNRKEAILAVGKKVNS
ncbi:MAG: class I SAM-dependent methyltransferase [Candidatus Hodarchaeota archaeon]